MVFSNRWISTGAKVLRAGFAGTLVVGAFGLVALRVGLASAADMGMNVGDQLMTLGEKQDQLSGANHGDVYDVVINGQTIETKNAMTARPLHDVLLYFKSQCDEHANGMRESFQNLDTTLSELGPSSGHAGVYAVRADLKDHGFVFCLATDHELSKSEALAGLGELGRTGDISKIGGLRYVAAKVTPTGTRVVTAWSDGTLNLHTMFPSDGSDAPGVDFGDVPRPDGARRILSGTVRGEPFGVNGYAVHGTPDESMKKIDEQLLGAGFKAVPTGPDTPKAGKYYTYGDRLDVVVNAGNFSGGSAPTTDVTYVVSRSLPLVKR